MNFGAFQCISGEAADGREGFGANSTPEGVRTPWDYVSKVYLTESGVTVGTSTREQLLHSN